MTPEVRRLSLSLYLIADICNVYLIVRGERAILIDSGMGRCVELLDGLGVRTVDWVLHTHFHRDQCAGTSLLADLGAKVAAPAAEQAYFSGAEAFWRTRNIYDNYNTYNDFAAPLADIPIDRALEDEETFAWEDLALRIVPVAGHTKGAIAVVGEIDGRRVAFAGDTIHHSARPWTLFDLEWGYGAQEGAGALALSVQTLGKLDLDAILPSHGEPIADPAGACTRLIRRIGAYHEWLHLATYPGLLDYAPTPAEAHVQAVTPHLWASTVSVANSYTLLDDAGAALFMDYGFPSYGHFLGGPRFAEHMLDDLRRTAGMTSIHAVMPSHHHDDHVCGLQYLQERYGAELWVFEDQEDILAHPEAYKLPCLWPKPMKASRVFGDGETFHWGEIAFAAARTPGHTGYDCALRFEVDGRRVVHVGDTLGRSFTGPRLGGPIFPNRFAPGDFLTGIGRIRDFEPEIILTGHWGPLHITPAFLDEALRRARSLNDVLWDLIAVPEEAGFAYDPNWATIYPYQTTLRPGEMATIGVRTVNHLSADTRARATLQAPEGWSCEPPEVSATIGRGAQGRLDFTLRVPEDVPSGLRTTIAASISLDDRPFGSVAEGIVEIV